MNRELGASFVMVWVVFLSMTMASAASTRSTKWRFSEKLVRRRAKRMAAVEVENLRRFTSLSAGARLFLQKEAVLMNAAVASTVAKLAPTFIASILAAAALMNRVVQSHLPRVWRDVFAAPTAIAVVSVTVAFVLAADSPAQGRWTTSVITSAARRALLALLRPHQPVGAEPSGDRPYEPSRAPAVRALDDLAGALEKYALQRALPDGRTPMSEVVTEYAAAATLFRQIRDGVELDGDKGRINAIEETQRLIERLASSSIRGFADREQYPPSPVLVSHLLRRERRRQTFALTSFTAVISGVLLLVGPTSAGAAVIGVAAAPLIAVWVKALALPGGRSEGPFSGQ